MQKNRKITHYTSRAPRGLKNLDKLNCEAFYLTPEKVLELVENNLLPYYVVDNSKPLYSQTEVKTWVNKHLVSKYEGMSHPPQITGIKKLRFLFEEYCGIYFLIKDRQVVYVGQSIHIPSRVKTHRNEKLKVFDNAFYVLYEKSKLNDMEQYYIQYLKPKYNYVPVQKSIKIKKIPEYQLPSEYSGLSIKQKREIKRLLISGDEGMLIHELSNEDHAVLLELELTGVVTRSEDYTSFVINQGKEQNIIGHSSSYTKRSKIDKWDRGYIYKKKNDSLNHRNEIYIGFEELENQNFWVEIIIYWDGNNDNAFPSMEVKNPSWGALYFFHDLFNDLVDFEDANPTPRRIMKAMRSIGIPDSSKEELEITFRSKQTGAE